MSTVVIVFPGAPKVDPAAAAREEDMKKNVAKHVEGEWTNGRGWVEGRLVSCLAVVVAVSCSC